jgi:hypothetical protein
MKQTVTRQEDLKQLAIFEQMRPKGWVAYKENPDLYMERVQLFLDATKVLYPND